MRRILALLALAVFTTASAPASAVEYDPADVAAARSAFVDRLVAAHGFERAWLERTLAEAEILDSVLEAISRPVERVVPWHEYREIFLNDARIEAGVAFWREHEALIESKAAEHGVDVPIVLAILGVETMFGARMGSYRVLDSLATLAFAYPPRAEFFASELEAFLLLAREEGLGFLEAKGSYAGAMGAGQFIPSSYRAYALDGDGDGRRDLWENWSDALASVANYLAEHDWRAGEPVAVPAERPADFSGAEPDNGLDLDATVGALRDRGYEFETDLPASAAASVMAFESGGGDFEYWVGFHNFFVITRYNRSIKYALAAYELGEAIDSAHERSQRQEATP